MTTKTLELRAIDLLPGLGNDRDGIPFRSLSSMVEKVRNIVPDSEEVSCKVHGAAGLTFSYEHTLTAVEQLQADLAVAQAKLDALKSLRRPDGTLVSNFDAILKQIGI